MKLLNMEMLDFERKLFEGLTNVEILDFERKLF